MGKRARAQGITNAAVRAARAAWAANDDEAAAVCQSIYNAIRQAKNTGEAGDLHPLLWGPVVVTADMMAQVTVRANRLDPGKQEEVAAYFAAAMIAGVQLFDFEHFEKWRRETADDETTDASQEAPG